MRNLLSVKALRKLSFIIVISSISFLNLSFIDGFSDILTKEDLSIPDREGYAVTFPAEGIGSKFEWHCYSGQPILVKCQKLCEAEDPSNCHDDDPQSGFASITVETNGLINEYDYEEREDECQTHVDEINSFLYGESRVCILAAEIQDLDDNMKLWSLFRIKTRRGAWGMPFDSESETIVDVSTYEQSP